MSLYISNEPAELDKVCKAILLLSWQDCETLAMTIDSVRRDSKKESRKSLSANHIVDGVKYIIFPKQKGTSK